MQVVIVESAAKAKSINKYLGSGYQVLASYGHVRDLPSKDGSVDPDNEFAMIWESDPRSVKVINDITKAVKGADKLILATDPDREGEAISWHLLNILEAKKAIKDKPVERVAFNAVTKQAVLQALDNPREIDMPLVDAYLARRALDYLVGFTLSPVLWRKLPGSRSAGRVQSVALRLICDREEEIERFVPQEYWNLTAFLTTAGKDELIARLYAIDGKRVDKFDINNEADAHAVRDAMAKAAFTVGSVEAKAVKRNPSPPFTTSTLQQEASRKLGFGAKRTMTVAQKLYEGVELGGETVGLITYMRTDGVQMIPEAISRARSVIEGNYGKRYLPPSPRMYKTKAKNAQEAHEAVRPTDFARTPEKVSQYLSGDDLKLYRLIWQRAIASQMAAAEMERTTVDLRGLGGDDKTYTVRVVGTVVTFDGFLKLYQEGRDDEADEAERRLPKMAEGDSVNTKKISATQHFTEPPPRYSEASLVKRMEELGIGRPSTYASTLAVLVDREYVRNESRRLFPEDKGRLVTAFLKSFFARYVEYDFTAALEEDLDEISDGKLEWKQVLRDFWREFTSTVDGTKELRITDVLDALNEALAPIAFPPREDGSDPRVCIACGTGQLSLKVGRYGAFVGCSNHPECKFTRPLGESDEEAAKKAKADGRVLGQDEETGLDITVRSGRFGPYIQVGEQEGKEKPKRASIPAGYDAASLTYDEAVQLLALPRPVGVHPETSKPIVAGFGRYGPFVECAGTYANLDDAAEVFTVGINRAVALLADKSKAKAKRGGSAIREIGPHPADKQMIEVMEGRYGTYLRHGKVNATLPKGTEQADITLEQAVEIIKERGKAAGSKAGAKKTTTARSGGTKAAGSKAAGSKATGSKAGTSKAVGSKSTAAKGTAAKAKGTTKAAGSTTRKSPAKKPAASAAKRKPANKSSEAPS